MRGKSPWNRGDFNTPALQGYFVRIYDERPTRNSVMSLFFYHPQNLEVIQASHIECFDVLANTLMQVVRH